jgi:hypothetical protein
MHLMNKLIITFYILYCSILSSNAQEFYRFKAETSIKDKLSDGSFRLTMGKVYYDKLYKKIVYKLNFPKNETIVVQDTTMYIINTKNVIETTNKTILIPEFTAFHLALTGKLSDYGLKPKLNEKSVYKIGKIEKKENGVLTTWVPSEENYKKVFGNIEMLNINKRLDAMLFYNSKGKLVSRQFFKKYVNVKGVEFPTEVTMISYGEKGEKNIQLTTYKNVVIDQNNEDEIYRYKLPITRSATIKK